MNVYEYMIEVRFTPEHLLYGAYIATVDEIGPIREGCIDGMWISNIELRAHCFGGNSKSWVVQII